jgi:hypothetical protein
MKQLVNTVSTLLLMSALLVACRKDNDSPNDYPQSNEVRLVFDSLPGISGSNQANLYAIVSISKASGEEIISNRRLALTFSNKFVSEKLDLDNNRYKITRLLIVKGTETIQFAAPVANSPKAQQVAKPLSVEFSVPKPSLQDIRIDILKVVATDRPEDFGYPAGTFDPKLNDSDSFFKIKVKAVFQVGNILYDSIPAALTVTTWDSSGQVNSRAIDLLPGTNVISVIKAARKYQLKIQKWGTTDERLIDRTEINEETVFSLGGSRQAKKLRLEEDYLLVSGSYVPDGKVIYTYHPDGLINKVEYYQKKPEHSDLKNYFTDFFSYAGNNVSKIVRKDANLSTVGFTDFTYGEQHKVTNIHHKIYDTEIFAAVDYSYSGPDAWITIDYLYNNGQAMEYKMTFRRGNKVEDAAVSSTGSREGGTYQYDFNVNPYAHMNMPDLYLSNLSRNNLTKEDKGYGGNIPSNVPYKFEYQYDQDGYPIQVIKSYKSYATGQELFKIKTVYSYQ